LPPFLDRDSHLRSIEASILKATRFGEQWRTTPWECIYLNSLSLSLSLSLSRHTHTNIYIYLFPRSSGAASEAAQLAAYKSNGNSWRRVSPARVPAPLYRDFGLYARLVRARAQPPLALPAPFLRHPRARRRGETRRCR